MLVLDPGGGLLRNEEGYVQLVRRGLLQEWHISRGSIH